ncbi:MAG: acetolactate synthase, partial [Verrucomicrobia bacterium]|nr:acetolactate synthase [Verrucomicrobiota bacterium]
MRSLPWIFLWIAATAQAASPLVLQTDFGQKDGAVAAMKGVAVGVSPQIPIYDLSHENTPYDIWEGAYRLKQTAPFWPAGTVFVSVVDPGVGTERKAVVLKTKTGQFFVGPDNGTWTLVAEDLGIEAVREIDEARHRRPGSELSHT